MRIRREWTSRNKGQNRKTAMELAGKWQNIEGQKNERLARVTSGNEIKEKGKLTGIGR